MQVIDDLINASDAAMYQAKRAGGNQVCHSQVAPPLA
jgi:PleD family two-component response regulator